MPSWVTLRRLGCLIAPLLITVLLLWMSQALRPEPMADDLKTHAKQRTPRAPLAGYTVGGIIVDDHDEPVPDVSILLTGSSPAQSWSTTTGEDGRFVVRGVSGVVDVQPELETRPAARTVFSPRTDLRFIFSESCRLNIEVIENNHENTPIEGAEVVVHMASGPVLVLETDSAGRAIQDDVPCGPATVEVNANGFHTATEPTETANRWSLFYMDPISNGGVRVFGRVHAYDEPISGAEVAALPIEGVRSGQSGPDGRYSIVVSGAGPHVLVAEHDEFQYEFDPVLVPPGLDEWQHDIELEPIRKVKVFCAGMPDDGCHDLPLVMCTAPWAPVSHPCEEESSVITCRCPMGEAAVRGGGESVRVGPDDTEAWLDLRSPGGLSGEVHVDGEPGRCTLEVVQWSLQLAGGGGLRTHACDSDGSFFIPSLQQGRWRVVVRAEGLETAVGPVLIEDAVVDVGVVDLTGGTMLAGRVLWAEDETPVAETTVAAVELGSLTDGAAPPVGTATTDAEGHFQIFGLEPGRYQVLLPRDPEGAEVVHLSDEDVYVELFREGGSGLRLSRGDDGDPVVAEGDAAGWLETGDRIIRVEVAGIDVSGMMSRYGDAVGETILGMAGWPGLTIEVERDGERLIVGEE